MYFFHISYSLFDTVAHLLSHYWLPSAAQAARLLLTADPVKSASYRSKAELAWSWAEANRVSNIPAGRSTRFNTLVTRFINDARNLAAVDLYRLTGTASYHTVFLATTVFNSAQSEVFAYDSVGLLWDQAEAAWSYSQITTGTFSSTVKANCIQSIYNSANSRVTQYSTMGEYLH